MQPSNLRGVASMASTRVPSPLKAPRRRRDARSFPERHGLNHVPLRIIICAPPLFFPLLAQVLGVLREDYRYHGRHDCSVSTLGLPSWLQPATLLLLGVCGSCPAVDGRVQPERRLPAGFS